MTQPSPTSAPHRPLRPPVWFQAGQTLAPMFTGIIDGQTQQDGVAVGVFDAA